MLNQEQLFTIINKPKWEWFKVNSQLRTSIRGKQTTYSLQPNLRFQRKNCNGQNTKLHLRVCIDTQKSLKYENQVGWNWHKSSNIPLISIKVELRTPDTGILLPLPQNIKAKIFIVEIISNILGRQKISYLQDVGIRGQNTIRIKDGYGVFNGIKFITTSYKNQGVKFHILILIYIQKQQQQKQQQIYSNILFSTISSPVFVDSRKSARDYQEKRFLSFVQIFHPGFLNKEFAKKMFMLKGEFSTKINNNIQGLFNYLTASNIHYKVKHPIFLSVKFSKVFTILYNKSHKHFSPKTLDVAPPLSQLTSILFKLQKCLIKQFGNKTQREDRNLKINKLFIVKIIDIQSCKNYKKSKIFQCLEFLQSKNIQFVKEDFNGQEQFQNICLLGDVGKTYVQIYQQLAEMTKKQIDNRNYIDYLDKQENKKSQTDKKKPQKLITFSNSSQILYQNNQQQVLQQHQQKNELQQQQQDDQNKQKIIEQNKRQQNYRVINIPQIQVIEGIQVILNPYFPNIYHENNLYPIHNQFNFVNYQPLVNQIKYQNCMLQNIIKQNIAMRENLLCMIMEKQNKDKLGDNNVKMQEEEVELANKKQHNEQNIIQLHPIHKYTNKQIKSVNADDIFLKVQN